MPASAIDGSPSRASSQIAAPGGADRPVADPAPHLLVRAARRRARSAILISVSSLAGPTTVSYGPVWNSLAGTILVPVRLWITMVAFSAANAADRSSDGSAWQSDPPTVPQSRTTGSAITRSASCRIAKCSPATAESSS